MPELPEVETTRRAIEPVLAGHRVRQVAVRQPRLRWPVPADLAQRLVGQQVLAVRRRAKYLLVETAAGTLLIHLGMSGSFCIAPPGEVPKKHDHVDIVTDRGVTLRYSDPRRFGAFLWLEGDPGRHPLLAGLGPEPLGDDFDGAFLHRLARGRRSAVKTFIMDGHVVVGVGNIYANEALHMAGIRPGLAAGRVSLARYERLAEAIRAVLAAAIAAGGTTLRDFAAGERQNGYFRVSLAVYGRSGAACLQCGTPLRESRLGGRGTWWCPACQR